MNKLPSCSLVIATYNWPQALESCLISVMRQSELPDEVLIADDGSGRETKYITERMKGVFPIPLKHIWQEDKGFRLAMIRNKAMAAAAGEYIIQVDGDVILHPDFVKDHLHAARQDHFAGGSRVLLNKELSEKIFQKNPVHISLLSNGVKNKLNGLHFPLLAQTIELFRKEKGLYNMRGCNMAFWKKDIVGVNGYNENISGWGREDTELAIRFYNAGLKRVYFKLQGIVYHLYHQECDRSSLLANDEILQATKTSKLSYCEKGIDQYLQ